MHLMICKQKRRRKLPPLTTEARWNRTTSVAYPKSVDNQQSTVCTILNHPTAGEKCPVPVSAGCDFIEAADTAGRLIHSLTEVVENGTHGWNRTNDLFNVTEALYH